MAPLHARDIKVIAAVVIGRYGAEAYPYTLEQASRLGTQDALMAARWLQVAAAVMAIQEREQRT